MERVWRVAWSGNEMEGGLWRVGVEWSGVEWNEETGEYKVECGE